MKLETKYNVGDKIWAMYNNRPNIYEVLRITVSCDDIDKNISYRTNDGKYFSEEDIFSSKEELLKSL